MSEYLERTLASKPTFGDYVTLEMKCYGVPNEHFIHEVLSSPFTSNSWRNVPIDARDPEEHLHDTSETVIAVRTQGINSRDAQIFAVRLADVLPMKGTNWSWRESPLRSRIAELEADKERLNSCESALISMVQQFFYNKDGEDGFRHAFMSAEEEAAEYLVEHGIARWAGKNKSAICFNEVQE